jgi:hypothetical protein
VWQVWLADVDFSAEIGIAWEAVSVEKRVSSTPPSELDEDPGFSAAAASAPPSVEMTVGGRRQGTAKTTATTEAGPLRG